MPGMLPDARIEKDVVFLTAAPGQQRLRPSGQPLVDALHAAGRLLGDGNFLG